MGISRPFNVLQRGTDMENVLNVIAITVAQAQDMGNGGKHGKDT
jgi:malate dehydrogenase (oxaloacetate-decarboxylating)(NADP+)